MYIHTLPINADRPISFQFSSRLLLSSVLCLFSFLCFSSILSCALVFFFPFLFSSEMKNVVHLGGGGTFTTRFDKVAAIGVSELLLLLLVESESDSSRSLRKWLHFTHFFAPRVFVLHFLQNITFAHRTSRSTRVDVSPFAC